MGDMAEYTDETAFAAEAKFELRELMYGSRNKPRKQTKEPDYIIHQNLLMDDLSDSERKERMIKQYNFNANAKVGTEIVCPCCATKFVKKSYQQKFCGNKVKGRSNCKDFYHNWVSGKHLSPYCS